MIVVERVVRWSRRWIASVAGRLGDRLDPSDGSEVAGPDRQPVGDPPGRDPPVRADGGRTDAEIEMVVAIIRPGKLNEVKQALVAAEAPSLTVTNVSGRGSQPDETGEWHGEEYIVDLHQKIKIECAVVADRTDDVVDAIREAASTGQPGDGKIFVLPVYEACRVSTNERGAAAM